MRGRPRKPTHLKLLEGTYRKDRASSNEPKPEAKIPTCPRFLQGEARKEWHRMTKLLFPLGLLTELDRAALAGYCQSWARWIYADEKLKEQGSVLTMVNGNLVQNPYVGIANTAMAQMRKLLVEFGMTPASRSRVNVSEPETEDSFENFMRRK